MYYLSNLYSVDNEDGLDILRCIIKAAPYFKSVISSDNLIAVCDTEIVIYEADGDKMKSHGSRIGTPLTPGEGLSESVRTGQLISAVVNMPNGFDFPFKATTMALKDDAGRIVGGLTVATSLENQSILSNAARSLSATSQEIMTTSEGISNSAMKLADEINDIKAVCADAMSQISKTDDILRFINDMALNSNLLGINASIEATHAGEYGRGFAVVADEMRKMALKSRASINDISESVAAIHSNFKELLNRINRLSEQGETQAAASEEIAASMSDLVETAENVMKVAQIV